MTLEEYNTKINEAKKRHEAEINSLHKEYAMSNAKFSVGDIIKDHRWTLLIDKITWSKFMSDPEPVYQGLELKKDLTPRKDGSRVSIYGNKADLVKKAETNENIQN